MFSSVLLNTLSQILVRKIKKITIHHLLHFLFVSKPRLRKISLTTSEKKIMPQKVRGTFFKKELLKQEHLTSIHNIFLILK